MKTKEAILKQFISRSNQYISGEELANSLQLSRTSIWKAVHELKSDGYEIDSVISKGYRFNFPSRLSKEMIEFLLGSHSRIQWVEFKKTTDSTQNDAKRLALDPANQEVLVVSEYQTQTRGRFGRQYFVPESEDFISMSLLTLPNSTFIEVSQYTLLAAAAVVKAIEKLTHIKVFIKWVNDIYLNGKKICGILSEAITDIESNQITSIIIGVGLNFSIPQEIFPKELQEKATSLFSEEIPFITRNELIAEIWEQFYQLMDNDFVKIYRQHSFVFGKRVSFIENNKIYEGIAKQVTDTGELMVFLDDGTTRLLHSGEISLSKIN